MRFALTLCLHPPFTYSLNMNLPTNLRSIAPHRQHNPFSVVYGCYLWLGTHTWPVPMLVSGLFNGVINCAHSHTVDSHRVQSYVWGNISACISAALTFHNQTPSSLPERPCRTILFVCFPFIILPLSLSNSNALLCIFNAYKANSSW